MDCKKAEARIDFLQYLETDISIYIMSFLHDPADLVRASSVSHFWHQFVIENGFAKELCLKTFSGCSNFLGTVNESTKNWDNSLETDHQVYAALLYAFVSTANKYPSQNIAETRYIPNIPPLDRITNWFSSGQRNAHVPETLIYKLRHGLYAFTEIKVRPCRAKGSRDVFSAKSVRFRIGHAKSPRENAMYPITDDKVEWTYTSPQFPMKQEHKIQSFKLPQPVLCLGGYLKIELLGRVQRHQKDGLFYICLSYVRALGHRLSPAFEAKIHKRYGKYLLMYNPDKLGSSLGRVFKAIY
ncbi:hypothetical protein RD792_007139 [Penstemon davidsonii]|uniref:F-box domain-containing protein n=1 Tax=Penstemon davidsonii TaxID=160366 RepID=A0ABR0D693_9LAMI|nr:hypothetical protein RD792_007139 [Penstemon davidsonii]